MAKPVTPNSTTTRTIVTPTRVIAIRDSFKTEQVSRIQPPPVIQSRLVIVDDAAALCLLIGVCALGIIIPICLSNTNTPIRCDIGWEDIGFPPIRRGSGRDCWLKWLFDMAMIEAEYEADLIADALSGNNDADPNRAHRVQGAIEDYNKCVANGGMGNPDGLPIREF